MIGIQGTKRSAMPSCYDKCLSHPSSFCDARNDGPQMDLNNLAQTRFVALLTLEHKVSLFRNEVHYPYMIEVMVLVGRDLNHLEVLTYRPKCSEPLPRYLSSSSVTAYQWTFNIDSSCGDLKLCFVRFSVSFFVRDVSTRMPRHAN